MNMTGKGSKRKGRKSKNCGTKINKQEITNEQQTHGEMAVVLEESPVSPTRDTIQNNLVSEAEIILNDPDTAAEDLATTFLDTRSSSKTLLHSDIEIDGDVETSNEGMILSDINVVTPTETISVTSPTITDQINETGMGKCIETNINAESKEQKNITNHKNQACESTKKANSKVQLNLKLIDDIEKKDNEFEKFTVVFSTGTENIKSEDMVDVLCDGGTLDNDKIDINQMKPLQHAVSHRSLQPNLDEQFFTDYLKPLIQPLIYDAVQQTFNSPPSSQNAEESEQDQIDLITDVSNNILVAKDSDILTVAQDIESTVNHIQPDGSETAGEDANVDDDMLNENYTEQFDSDFIKTAEVSESTYDNQYSLSNQSDEEEIQDIVTAQEDPINIITSIDSDSEKIIKEFKDEELYDHTRERSDDDEISQNMDVQIDGESNSPEEPKLEKSAQSEVCQETFKELLEVLTQSMTPVLENILQSICRSGSQEFKIINNHSKNSKSEDRQRAMKTRSVTKTPTADSPDFESTRLETSIHEETNKNRLLLDLTGIPKHMDLHQFEELNEENTIDKDKRLCISLPALRYEERFSSFVILDTNESDENKSKKTKKLHAKCLTTSVEDGGVSSVNVATTQVESQQNEDMKSSNEDNTEEHSSVVTNKTSTLAFSSTENDQGQHCHDPLRFHSVHGKNVDLTQNNLRVQRKKNSNFYSEGIVFSSRPIAVNEKVCLRLEQVARYWLGFLTIGFTTNDPNSIADHLPMNAISALRREDGYWAEYLNKKYCHKNCTLHYYLNSSGNMCFGVDGVDKIEFLWNLETTTPIWALIDIFGSSTIIELQTLKNCNMDFVKKSNPFLNKSETGCTWSSSLEVNSKHTCLNYQIQFVPLELHSQFKGIGVQYLEDRGVCVASGNRGGCITSKLPLFPGQTIVVQSLSERKLFFFVGVKYCSPIFEKINTLQDPVGTNVLMYKKDELAIHFTENGEVQVAKNLNIPKTMLKVNRTEELWPFVKMFERNQMIKMWSSYTPSLGAFQS